MNIQQLNDDCLKAVLIRLPIKEFIQNVKPVSRRFRDVTEFSMKDLVAREPVSLEVCGGCSHSSYGYSSNPPRITLAGVNVASTNFAVLKRCPLLPLVSKVSLCDPFCSMVPRDFRDLLRAVLVSLSGATELELALQENEHFGNPDEVDGYSSDDSYVSDTRDKTHGEQRPFFRLFVEAACQLEQLQSLKLTLHSRNDELRFSTVNLDDFPLLLNVCECLSRLVIPIPLFVSAFKSARASLKSLNALELFASGGNLRKSSCQSVLEMIGDACPELTFLRYNCITPLSRAGWCNSDGCVTDLGVLQPLSKLRSLTLRLGSTRPVTQATIPSLPSVEFLRLYLSDSVSLVTRMMQMLKLGCNLKSLELLWDHPFAPECLAGMVLAHLKDQVASGALPRLENILIDTSDSHEIVSSQIHAITTMPMFFSLRKITILEYTTARVITLPPANSSHADAAGGPESGITYAIAKAENITELSFTMKWSDSYLQLEQLLLAMQHGSLKRLIVAVNWHSGRPYFGIDKRVINSILPAGCQIAEWNISMKDDSAKLTSVVIVGHKLGFDNIVSSNQDEGGKFWVRLEAQSKSNYDKLGRGPFREAWILEFKSTLDDKPQSCNIGYDNGSMSVEALNDECLKAILRQLPLHDFVKNARFVSRRFLGGTEIAFNDLITRLQPICLDVFGNCRHCEGVKPGLKPQISLEGISIRLPKLPELPVCPFLALVSKVRLHAPICEDLPSDFKVQLRHVLQNLPAVESVTFSYDPYLRDYDFDYFELTEHAPFVELKQNCLPLLASLQFLELPLDLKYARRNRREFFELLSSASQLRTLIVPVELFCGAQRVASESLSCLETLVLSAIDSSRSNECNEALRIVCKHCSNLQQLKFSCHNKRDHRCLRAFSDLQKLSKLRSLTIKLSHTKDFLFETSLLASVESMQLDLPVEWKYSQLLQLIGTSPNLKSLTFSQPSNADQFYFVFVALLHNKQLDRLVSLCIVDTRANATNLFSDGVERLASLPFSCALRHLTFQATHLDTQSFDQLLNAVSPAENVRQLSLRLKSIDPTVQLNQLRRAMQCGSIRRLMICVDWRTKLAIQNGCDTRYGYGVMAGKKLRSIVTLCNSPVKVSEPFWIELHDFSSSADEPDTGLLCPVLSVLMQFVERTQFH